MRLEFPAKLGFLFKKKRFKGAYGGRGSGKSWAFARALLVLGFQSRMKILCAREFQNSLDESVMALLAKQIEMMEAEDPRMKGFYTVYKSEIRGANGSRFIFEGIRYNISSIKSYEDCDIIWIEEADNVSEESWQAIIPTFRKEGSEIWLTWNPKSKHDPTHRRFIDHPPEDSIIVQMNWRDNPWFNNILQNEMLECKRRSMAEYLHVWEGHTREDSGDTVFKPSWDQFWLPERWDNMNRYVTVDPANTKTKKSDYTVFTVWGAAADRNLYVLKWVRDRFDVYERINMAFRLHEQYRPINTGWEITGMSADADVLAHEQRIRNYRFPVTQLKPATNTSKEARIEAALLPLLADKRLYVPESCIYTTRTGETFNLTDQYLKEKDAFPNADGVTIHDDMLDSMAYIMHPDMGLTFPSLDRMRVPQRREYDPANHGF